jgi:hypothetical protein
LPIKANNDTVYNVDDENEYRRLVKFKDYLKDELPRKVCADMSSDFGSLPEWRSGLLQQRVEEITRNCTEQAFRAYQRPLSSSPLTPLQFDEVDSLTLVVLPNESASMCPAISLGATASNEDGTSQTVRAGLSAHHIDDASALDCAMTEPLGVQLNHSLVTEFSDETDVGAAATVDDESSSWWAEMSSSAEFFLGALEPRATEEFPDLLSSLTESPFGRWNIHGL